MSVVNLDTILSFAVVMLLLSLVITTLVQLVSHWLGLRRKHLLWGLTRLLEQVDPDLAGHANTIAKAIVQSRGL